MTSRREFLKRLAIVSAGSVVPYDAARLFASSTKSAAEGEEIRTLGLINAFVDPLRRLQKAIPRRMRDGSLKLHIRMSAFRQSVHTQILPTLMWGYNGTVPGPTIEVRRGQVLHVEWENLLPSRHMFPVDKTLHGCTPPSAEVRTVVHVHGAHVPSSSDGLPERSYGAGKSVVYSYPNNQRATALWYHDHAVGITRLECGGRSLGDVHRP
jgi:spore coat protein A